MGGRAFDRLRGNGIVNCAFGDARRPFFACLFGREYSPLSRRPSGFLPSQE